MEPYALVDRSTFPIIVVEFTGHAPTDENFRAYLEALRVGYEEHEALAFVFDATRATFPPMKYQRMQAAWLKENDNLIRHWCKGTAYVLPNFWVRLALRLIFLMQKQPVPLKICADRGSARAWAERQLG